MNEITTVDYDIEIPEPELFLLKPDGYDATQQRNITIAQLSDAFDINRKIKMNNVNELEFKVPYFIEFNHKIIDNPAIEQLRERYIIRFQSGEEEELYLIDSYSNKMTESNDYRQVKCLELPYELSDTYLQNFNTDDSEGYTVREVLQGKSSAGGSTERNGLLAKTNWTVGHIDTAYDYANDTGLPFVVRGKSTVLNAILSMALMYKCTIVWDSLNRKINIYEPGNVGGDRGLHFSYGQYLRTLDNDFNMDKMVTRLYVYGKDNLSIEDVSPLGQNYIEDYTYYMYPFERDPQTKRVIKSSNYMTDALCHAILDYKQLIDSNKAKLKQLTDGLKSQRDTLVELEMDMYHKEQELIRRQDEHYIHYAIRQDITGFDTTGHPYTQDEYDSFAQGMGGGKLWGAVVTARGNYENAVVMVDAQKMTVRNQQGLVLDLRNRLSEERNFTPALLKEKRHFTKEREFTDSNQVHPDKLYDAGLKEFQALQLPEKTFKINIVNFLDCIEEQWNWDKLQLSEVVSIRHETLGVDIKARVVEIHFDYKSSQIQLTISVTEDFEDEATKLADLINKFVSTSIQVEATIPVWEELQDRSDYVSTIIDKFYDDVADQINLAVNQSVLINEYGITIHEMLSEDQKDEMNFLRITNGALGITNDGGETYKNAITSEGIIGERVIGKIIMGHNLILGDPDGMLEILGNKGVVRDRCLDPRSDTPTYLRGREVMRFGLYNYDFHNVDDYRNPHPTDISKDRFGIQLFGSFSNHLTVDGAPPVMGNSAGIPELYNAQPLSRITMDSQDGFFIDKWEDVGKGYDWNKKFYVDSEGALFAEDLTTYRMKIYQDPGLLLIDAENRFINMGKMAEMVLDGALTPIEKVQVKVEWARIRKEFLELETVYHEHKHTYRGGDPFGNQSNIDHLDSQHSPAWDGTSFDGRNAGLWSDYTVMYEALDKYLNHDIITLPDHERYPHGSLLSDARRHITERETDFDDEGVALEFGTGFDREVFMEAFSEYYEATQQFVDRVNTLIKWAGVELGKFYNDIRMDADDGIIVTRSDNYTQTWLSATDGFSIAKNRDHLAFSPYSFLLYDKPGAEQSGRNMESWQKLFYADDKGNLNLLGSLDMLSLDNEKRVLINQNDPDGIAFAIMGRSRHIGAIGEPRDYEKFTDHTGVWWRKLHMDTDGNLFVNDLTANRLILRDANGDVVIDANSGFLDLNKLDVVGNILADNIVTGTIIADVGHIADLTVNRLKSLDLSKEGQTANYIDIENQSMKWITAKLESTGVVRQQAGLNRESGEMEMMDLYWTDKTRTSTTVYKEDYEDTAILAYEQRIVDPVVKLEMTFEENDPNNIPKIILGEGSGDQDIAQGVIFKEYNNPQDQGLKLQYRDGTSASGRLQYMRFENKGIVFSIDGKKIMIDESDKGGLMLKSEGGSSISFDGSDINIKASGNVNINGQAIHLNT